MSGPNAEHAAKQEKPFLSPQEFSEHTGLSLSTVRRYLKRGKLPHSQLGGAHCRILIPVDALKMVPPIAPAEAATAIGPPANPPPETPSSETTSLPGPRPWWAQQAGAVQAKEQEK